MGETGAGYIAPLDTLKLTKPMLASQLAWLRKDIYAMLHSAPFHLCRFHVTRPYYKALI